MATATEVREKFKSGTWPSDDLALEAKVPVWNDPTVDHNNLIVKMGDVFLQAVNYKSKRSSFTSASYMVNIAVFEI